MSYTINLDVECDICLLKIFFVHMWCASGLSRILFLSILIVAGVATTEKQYTTMLTNMLQKGLETQPPEASETSADGEAVSATCAEAGGSDSQHGSAQATRVKLQTKSKQKTSEPGSPHGVNNSNRKKMK